MTADTRAEMAFWARMTDAAARPHEKRAAAHAAAAWYIAHQAEEAASTPATDPHTVRVWADTAARVAADTGAETDRAVDAHRPAWAAAEASALLAALQADDTARAAEGAP